MERLIEVHKTPYVVLYFLVMVAIIVGVDFLFLRHHSGVRLIVNIGVVVVFASFYLVLLRKR